MKISMKQLIVFPLEEGVGFNGNSLEINIINLSVGVAIVIFLRGMPYNPYSRIEES